MNSSPLSGLIATTSVIFILCLSGISFAADPPELENLRETYLEHKQKLTRSYIGQLSVLEENMLSTGNSSGARAVRQEKQKVSAELAAATKIQRPTPPPQPKPTPAPAPPPKKRDPKTHVSSIEGLAGAAKFSKNNIYTFNLPSIGYKTSVSFWATGRRSTESTGVVWLITPTGERIKVMKWKDSLFDKPSTEVSSYKKIRPITKDISELVTMPGVYKIEFNWTGGIDPLVIYRVEVTS